MTRKDYKKFADLLARVKTAEDNKEPYSALYISQVVAHVLAEDNPRFDGYRFSKAIGYNFNILL